MLKSILLKRTLICNMSQKLISDFLVPPKGQKRKLNEMEENQNPSLSNTCDDGSVEDRAAIIELAKRKPALSTNIGFTWFKALEKEFTEPYFDKLGQFLIKERNNFTIFPPAEEVYSWTNAVKIHDVKVVILGQDPYIRPQQAHGLAFSVCKGVSIPMSLLNIYKELEKDIRGFKRPTHGYLYGWASQGVFLLNTCLTVRQGISNSHKGEGWEQLTDSVIQWINDNLSNVVFMLWGEKAKKKLNLISSKKHLVLTAAHPSGFSVKGFFGCQHFSKTNIYLQKHNKKIIDWTYLP